MKHITNYSVEDHGIENAQYFAGDGVAYTRWDTCATGCGDTYNDALADALDDLATAEDCDSADLDRIESAERAGDDDDRDTVESVLAESTDDETDDGESDLHYYVTVYVSVRDDDDEPQEEDYILSPCGQLGGRTSVSQSGKCLGVFDDDGAALAFVRDHMETSKFWPNVWIMSDHGNAHLVDMSK